MIQKEKENYPQNLAQVKNWSKLFDFKYNFG